ncbi:hypothetical protein [Microvirga calopogonii]|uniref:hypothetical protein n=1 Tax=Microvirga calopogonii TaxID=2078013 RepID=UPI000E0D2733|nr:hypothetical protein [Microvirga calopogonii]
MSSILLPLSRVAALTAPALLLASAVAAQTPGPVPVRPKSRQPTPPTVQKEDMPTNANSGQSEADRKFREMDRRLGRTLRSICAGC